MWGNVWEWLATPGEAGEMKVKGGAFDSDRGDCRTEERGNARPADGRYANVGFRILRTKNQAAAVIQDVNAATWISRNFGRALAPEEYAVLEADDDADGQPNWAEYVALTDPHDAASFFAATIALDGDGVPVVGWNVPTQASRKYVVYGKESLDDSVWIEVRDNEALYRFFKVDVGLR